MQAFITILTFKYSAELIVIKAKLESEGIETFVKNELTAQVNPMLSDAIGGIELQVKKEDLNKAYEILNETGYKPQDPDGRSDIEKKLNNFLGNIGSKLKLQKYLNKKTLFVLIIIVVGLMLFKVCNKGPEELSIDDNLTMARDKSFNHEYELAIHYYSKALEQNSKIEAAYQERGDIYYKLKEYQNAISDFSKVITLNPQNPYGYVNRAISFIKLEKYQDAIPDLNTAIKLLPDEIELYKHRASAYLMMNQFDSAALDASMVIKMDSAKESYLTRGFLMTKMLHYESAIQDLEKAIGIDSANNHVVYFFLANAYHKMNNRPKACHYWKESANLGAEYAAFDSLKKYCK